MGRQHFFHATGGKPMAGDVDDVIGSRHHERVTIFVDETGVGGLVVAGKLRHVRRDESIVCVPQRWQGAGRERQFHHQGADLPGRHFFVVGIHHM